MDTEHYEPPLPPQSCQSVQFEHASRHSDLESDHSDYHSELEQPKRVHSKAKNILTNENMRYGLNITLKLSSSEEDESSATIKKPTKPQHKAPSEPEHQDSTDPVFYREVDIFYLPSQYAGEVETFRQILDLPDPRDTLPRSSTTVLGMDDEIGQQELRPRGPSAMFPLISILKDALEKFEQDFLASNLPEGKYIKPPASTANTYKVGQPCFENKPQELNTDFAKICISPKPSGALWARFPYKFLRNLNIKLGRIFLPSILQLLSLGLPPPVTLLWRSASTASRLPSKGLKTKFKKVPILKELRGYENACDYFEFMNKIILIQQRALACLSKSVAHILQRELYTMGNTGLLRQEAEMTTSRGLETSRTEAFLAFSSFQVSISEGWRRHPP